MYFDTSYTIMSNQKVPIQYTMHEIIQDILLGEGVLMLTGKGDESTKVY